MENLYKIGVISQNYPEPVQELVNLSMITAFDLGVIDDDLDPAVVEEQLCELALQKFLGDGEMIWEEGEFVEAINLAMAYTQINRLKTEGLIDSIEDERGSEVVWLTEKGKQICNEYYQTINN